VYIADHDNLRVRYVDLATGRIHPFAGNGNDAPPLENVNRLSSPLPFPADLLLSGNKLYVSDDAENGNRVSAIDLGNNRINRFAGTGACEEPVGDGGPPLAANLCFPFGIAVDVDGGFYVADTYFERIRKIAGGVITTIAGTGDDGFSGDGAPAVFARLNLPHGVVVAPDRSVYVLDSENHRIRRVAVCGNDDVESGETCDDGFPATSGDGCSELCRIEPQPPVVDTVPAGEDVATPNAAAPTASMPVGTAVTTPTGGEISITVGAAPPTVPSGFAALGAAIQVEAPVASVEEPLELVFRFDVSLVPLSTPLDDVEILRDAVEVDPCTDPNDAIPEPCVASRSRPEGLGGDVEIVVRAAHASEWVAATTVCGDGQLTGDETCDDGNVGSGDGCGPTCTVESCFACTGAGPGSCAPLPDEDGDGICNASDACTNDGGAQNFKLKPKPQIALSKINTDLVAGNDKLLVQGTFDLASGQTFASVTPAVSGARVLLLNRTGGVELDVSLPPETYGGKGTRGWKVNTPGTRWQYLDKTTDGTLSSTYGGIEQMQIVDRNKQSPGEVQVKVLGKNGAYPVEPGDAPLRAVVVLGGPAAGAAGLCGDSDFSFAECVFNKPANSLKCKK
jgi:cysteine-rich repeat protein